MSQLKPYNYAPGAGIYNPVNSNPRTSNIYGRPLPDKTLQKYFSGRFPHKPVYIPFKSDPFKGKPSFFATFGSGRRDVNPMGSSEHKRIMSRRTKNTRVNFAKGKIERSRYHHKEKYVKNQLGGSSQNKMWIQDAINPKHRGLLRKKLGISQGKKIPVSTLEKIIHKKNIDPTLKKEAVLARTLKRLHKKSSLT